MQREIFNKKKDMTTRLQKIKRSLFILSVTFVLMLVLMTVNDWVESLLFPNASGWERNLINIISASILAAIVSHFLSRNYEKNLLKHRVEIAARKKAEEEAIETLSILQTTLEATIDAILVISQERKVVTYNQKFIELWNIPNEIIETKDDNKLLGFVLSQLKDPEEFLRKVEELYQSPEQISFDVIEFKDGRIFERYSQPQKLGENIRGRIWSFDDITEKKKDELTIKESEARFKAIWKRSRDGYRLTDKNGIVIMVNDAYLGFVKKTEDEIIAKPFYIVYDASKHQSSIEKYKERFEKREFDGALLSQVEFGDERLVWFEVSNSFVEFEKETYLLSVFRDYSQNKEDQEKIILSEQKFRTLYEKATDAIFLMDGESFIDCNPTTEKMFGGTSEEILKLKPYEISPEVQEDGRLSKEKALEKISAALAGTPQIFDWKHRKLNGETFDCEVGLTKIELEGKNYIQAIVRDISERKHAEKLQTAVFKITEAASTATDLAELFTTIHESVKTLMPAINFYISLYDEKKNEISFPYFVDEFDESPESRPPKRGLTEYVLRTKSPLLATPDKLKEIEDANEVEKIGTDSIDWLGVPLIIQDKIIGVLVVQSYSPGTRYTKAEQDILMFVSSQIAMAISKKKAADNLTASELQLKEMNASKDKLFSIIAHDLRSPFQALLGMSELLATEVDEFSKEEITKFAGEMNNSLKNQFKLLENLLEWSRMQTGRMQYAPTKIILHEKVNDVIGLLSGNALKKNLTLINLVLPGVFILADENMLQSILQNLLANAIKFTKSGGTVQVSATQISEKLTKISIKDTGVGIDSKNLKKIFRTDSTVTTPGTENERGTGLGLLLCKEMIERHGGTISVESDLGKGTTFYFTLPGINYELGIKN